MEEIFKKAELILREEIALADAQMAAMADIDHWEKAIKWHQDRIATIKARMAEAKAPAEEIAARIAQMRAELLEAMGDVTDADNGRIILHVVNAGGKRAVEYDQIVETAPEELPEQFHKTKIVADKDEIRSVLEANEKLPPEEQIAITFARLLPRKKSLKMERAEIHQNAELKGD